MFLHALFTPAAWVRNHDGNKKNESREPASNNLRPSDSEDPPCELHIISRPCPGRKPFLELLGQGRTPGPSAAEASVRRSVPGLPFPRALPKVHGIHSIPVAERL